MELLEYRKHNLISVQGVIICSCALEKDDIRKYPPKNKKMIQYETNMERFKTKSKMFCFYRPQKCSLEGSKIKASVV